MVAPTFGPVPLDLYERGGLILARDVVACRRLKYLTEELTLSAIDGVHRYARGSWGYTVLRTVYTTESDALFSVALERLKLWVEYSVRSSGSQFLPFGKQVMKQQQQAGPGEGGNDETWRRFHLDVVEDKEALEKLDDATAENFLGLRDYFRQWVRRVGEDPSRSSANARFCDCIVINTGSLASLGSMADQPPSLRTTVTRDEKRQELTTRGDGWLWLLDTERMTRLDGHETIPKYKGWMKIRARDVDSAWFQRLFFHDVGFDIHVRQDPKGTGEFWFDDGKPMTKSSPYEIANPFPELN